MRILLAGATGVLGRRILPLLVSQGHQVTALTRRPEEARNLRASGADASVVDVYDSDTLHRVMLSANPDVVMHQLTDLSNGNSESNANLRTVGTRNLVNAALSAGVSKIVAQSVAWAYQPGEIPAGEATRLDLGSTEPRVTTVRGVVALEDTVAEMPAWVVLRYGLLYGPDTWYSSAGMMGDKARHGDLPVARDISSFVHIDDATAAAVDALEWPTGAVNICDDDPAPGTEWVPAFCELVGAETPSFDDTQPRNPWARGADNGLARDLRDWRPQHHTWREYFVHQGAEARDSNEL